VIFFEDIQVGDVFEYGRYTFTADNIKAFATRFDPQPFHVDEEAAARSHFGALVASGWHTALAWMRLMIDHRRRMDEAMLARRAATRATPANLRDLRQVVVEMRRRVEEKDAIGYSDLNARFHQLIWAAADHATASRLVGSLKSQSIRLQYQTILRPGRTERSLREHEAIFDALKAHDPDAAEEAMRTHLAEVQETLRWAIDGLRRAPSWLPG